MIYEVIIKTCLKLFCLIIVLSTFSCKTLFPQITNEEAQEVKNICSNLKPPASFAKTRDRYSTKPNSALHSIQYSSTDSSEEVEKYFVNLLKQSGWSYDKDVSTGTLKFKKGKYSISIEMPSFSFVSNKVYLVDCSIGIS